MNTFNFVTQHAETCLNCCPWLSAVSVISRTATPDEATSSAPFTYFMEKPQCIDNSHVGTCLVVYTDCTPSNYLGTSVCLAGLLVMCPLSCFTVWTTKIETLNFKPVKNTLSTIGGREVCACLCNVHTHSQGYGLNLAPRKQHRRVAFITKALKTICSILI